MNIIIVIAISIATFILGEFLSYCFKDVKSLYNIDKIFVYIIKTYAVVLPVVTLIIVNKNLTFTTECNDYKRTILNTQDSLITYQNILIDEMATHCEDEHNCDIPCFDGYIKDKVDEYSIKLDSLYNEEL